MMVGFDTAGPDLFSMHIPSASALLDALARISRFAEARPPPPTAPAERPEAAPGSPVETRQALLPPDAGDGTAGDFRRPPGDGPFRRGLLVDIRV